MTHEEALQELENATIALRYCTDPDELPALRAAKLRAEQDVDAIVDAQSDQDILPEGS